MTTKRELGSLRTYGRLVLVLTAASLVLMALGYVPTRRLAGVGAEGAMLAGVGISWFACAVAALPLVGLSGAPTPHMRLTLSTGLRFLLVVLLTTPVLFSGWFDRTPLLIWVGVSYFFLLMIDAVFALVELGVTPGSGNGAAGTRAGNSTARTTAGNLAGHS